MWIYLNFLDRYLKRVTGPRAHIISNPDLRPFRHNAIELGYSISRTFDSVAKVLLN